MQIQQNVPLAPYTTLRIGGPARFFARIKSEPDLLEAVSFARERSLPLFVLGGGSNLVVADEGFPGLVLHLALGNDMAFTKDCSYLEVSAGVEWDPFVRQVCEQGISGVECLAGIPGLVGGAPIQNIGAYGQEVSQTIVSVRALDLSATRLDEFAFVELPASHLGFAYRTSIFNTTRKNRYIVTRVDFTFSRETQPNLSYADLRRHFGAVAAPTPLEVYHAVRHIRAAKGMLIDPANPSPDTRSAGSFFKNPIVPQSAVLQIAHALNIPEAKVPHWPTPSGESKLPAAWLIEQAGFPKGFEHGSVGISSRHTLALINRTGTATCADLLALRDLIAAQVLTLFNVPLEQEPILLQQT